MYICENKKMEIYKTTNNINGNYYIGLNTTSNPKYLGSGVEIQAQIRKYGKQNFSKEILCLITSSFTDENILRKIEHLYISNHIQNEKCINRCFGYTKGKIEPETITVKKNKIEYIEVEKIVEVEKYKSRYEKMKLEVLILSQIFKVYKSDGITHFDGYGAKRTNALTGVYLQTTVRKKPVKLGRGLASLLK